MIPMTNALITQSMMDIGLPPLMAPGADSTAELDVHTRDLRGTAMPDPSLAGEGGAAMALHPHQEGEKSNGPAARALSAETGRTGAKRRSKFYWWPSRQCRSF